MHVTSYSIMIIELCVRVLVLSVFIAININISITASIDGLSDNGCSRFYDVPPSADICPRMGETVKIQCRFSTGNYFISRGSTMFPDNQPVVLMPFADSLAGTYKCTGDGNVWNTRGTIGSFWRSR